MIGMISGIVQFSDGQECLIQTASGLGHTVYCHHVLTEGQETSLYITHIIKEDSQTLFGFTSFRAKKLFELLLTVKGIGPKSAFALMGTLSVRDIVQAIQQDAKSSLTKVSGLGQKGASQIILDLQKKIDRIYMYSDRHLASPPPEQLDLLPSFLEEALAACRELGFRDEKILPIARRVMGQHAIQRPEQLVHLVLKEV